MNGIVVLIMVGINVLMIVILSRIVVLVNVLSLFVNFVISFVFCLYFRGSKVNFVFIIKILINI